MPRARVLILLLAPLLAAVIIACAPALAADVTGGELPEAVPTDPRAAQTTAPAGDVVEGAVRDPLAAAAALEQLEPLYGKRYGVSEAEPDLCSTTIKREANPSAGDRNGFEAGPNNFLVRDLTPGTSYRGCLTILNRYAEPRKFSLSTLDLVGDADPDVRLRTVDQPQLFGAWIHLQIDTVVLESGERVIIPYSVVVPRDAPGGSISGGIRVTDSAPSSSSSGGAQVQKSLVIAVQAVFPGGTSARTNVTNVRSPRFIVRSSGRSHYRSSYILVNPGTVVAVIRQRLVIDGLFGKEVDHVDIPEDVLIPGSGQRGSITWDDVPWIGRYTPRLEIRSEAGTTTVELPTVWIIPPWKYVIAFGIALLILIGGIIHRRRTDWRQYLDDDDDDDMVDPDDHASAPYY